MALTSEALKNLSKETGASIEKELPDWETASSSAYEILNTLKKADVTELKAYKAPPQLVKNVMKATMLVLGERDWESWGAGKKLMAGKFLERFQDFEPGNIDKKMVKKLEPFVDEFADETRAQAVSKAVAGMAAFARAAYEYGRDRA